MAPPFPFQVFCCFDPRSEHANTKYAASVSVWHWSDMLASFRESLFDDRQATNYSIHNQRTE